MVGLGVGFVVWVVVVNVEGYYFYRVILFKFVVDIIVCFCCMIGSLVE